MFSSSVVSAFSSLFEVSILWADFRLLFLLFLTEQIAVMDSVAEGEVGIGNCEGPAVSMLLNLSAEFLFSCISMREDPSDKMGDVAKWYGIASLKKGNTSLLIPGICQLKCNNSESACSKSVLHQ